MDSFKSRQSSQDLTRSRSYNSFLESSQSQLPPLYNRPAHLPHQQSFSELLRPSSSRTNSSRNIKALSSSSSTTTTATTPATTTLAGTALTPLAQHGKSLPGTPDITSDEGSEAGYFSTFSGPGYLKPSIVPTYEYYGFVLYLSSTVLFGLYLIWGLLGPETLEEWIGDLGYPDRWWALALPAWSIGALLYIYVALACYNTQVLTPKLNHTSTLTDGHAKICGREEADKWNTGTDAILDLPIAAVCDALYNEGGASDGDD